MYMAIGNFGKFLLHVLLPGIGTGMVGYMDDDQYGHRADENDKWFTKIVKGLNNVFNEEHDWFNYDKWNSSWDALSAKTTGSALTPAEEQANAFSASEAQKQRDWETEMSNTAYQRQVADMRAAGINPAMAMGGSGASTPSGSAPSSVTPQSGMDFQDILSLFMMPMQKKLMQAQAQMSRDQGEAALINAKANAGRLPIEQEGNDIKREGLDIQRYEAETRRMLKDIEERKTDIYESMTVEQKREIAERAAILKVQREQLPEQLDIAKKNASSQEQQAFAALKQADAAVQNAATNDRLADYETSLKYAEEMFTWYKSDGQQVVNKYLDERERAEIDRIIKDGIRLDKQGRLIDKTGHYITAQTVSSYVNSACNISNAVNRWVNPLSGMSLPSASPFTMDNTVGAGAGVSIFGGM